MEWFNYASIEPDMGSMRLVDALGLYLHLSRLAEN